MVPPQGPVLTSDRSRVILKHRDLKHRDHEILIHRGGQQGFVSFNFTQDNNCHLHLIVLGNINGAGWLAETPGLHQYYMHDAKHYCGAFAQNLDEEVQAANQEDAVGG